MQRYRGAETELAVHQASMRVTLGKGSRDSLLVCSRFLVLFNNLSANKKNTFMKGHGWRVTRGLKAIVRHMAHKELRASSQAHIVVHFTARYSKIPSFAHMSVQLQYVCMILQDFQWQVIYDELSGKPGE